MQRWIIPGLVATCTAIGRVNGETLINVTGLLAVVAWGMAVYYMWAFHLRWRGHMRSEGFRESSLWTYSGYALFWPNLPERCKVLRRELLLALSAFFTLIGIMIILFKSLPD